MKLAEQTVLGLEGSGFAISVGIMGKGEARGLIYLNEGSPGSEILLATIDQLLATLRMSRHELEGICVTLGPGSFTSLRISLAVAESLGLGLGLPVYGVDTLQLIAATVPYYADRIKVIQNAYKGEYYAATYVTREGRPQRLDDLHIIKPAKFYEQLAPGDLLLGTGVSHLLQKGYDLAAKQVRWNLDFQRTVSGIGVIEHFLDEEAREPSLKPLEPIYIRPSEAEINYKKQFGSG